MLEIGTKLGNYKIIGILGSGGMADVYEAADEALGRRVALKVLPFEFGRNPTLVMRFEKEVRAAASLNHSGIVTIFEVGHAQGVHYYSMRLLTGGDLRGRIDRGLTEVQALSILREVTDAFAHAHSSGFVHRDVKPENILFDEQGRSVLTDFGIAKAISASTKMTATGVSIGTPRYISPEQARGRPVDQRADIYSLGVIFFEMLSGVPPYQAEDSLAVIFKHVTEPIPRLAEKYARFQPLIDSLMAKEPAHRPASCGDLLTLIDELSAAQDAGSARLAVIKAAQASTVSSVVTLVTGERDHAQLLVNEESRQRDAELERRRIEAEREAEVRRALEQAEAARKAEEDRLLREAAAVREAEIKRLREEEQARERAKADAERKRLEAEAAARRAEQERRLQAELALRKAEEEQRVREQQARLEAEAAARRALEQAEAARKAEEKRLQAELNAQRRAEKERLAQEASAAKHAEKERREAAAAAVAQQRKQEQQRKSAENQRRIDEKRARKLAFKQPAGNSRGKLKAVLIAGLLVVLGLALMWSQRDPPPAGSDVSEQAAPDQAIDAPEQPVAPPVKEDVEQPKAGVDVPSVKEGKVPEIELKAETEPPPPKADRGAEAAADQKKKDAEAAAAARKRARQAEEQRQAQQREAQRRQELIDEEVERAAQQAAAEEERRRAESAKRERQEQEALKQRQLEEAAREAQLRKAAEEGAIKRQKEAEAIAAQKKAAAEAAERAAEAKRAAQEAEEERLRKEKMSRPMF